MKQIVSIRLRNMIWWCLRYFYFCCILNVFIALVSLRPFTILFSKNWQLSKATQSRLKFSAQNISESLKGWKEENCGPVRALWPFKEQYRVDFLFAVAQSSSEWEKLHLRKRRNPPQNEKILLRMRKNPPKKKEEILLCRRRKILLRMKKNPP